jgi:hypothetical protein
MNGGTSKSQETRITDHKKNQQLYGNHCQCPGHWTSKCCKFTGNKCFNCGKYGHRAKDCHAKMGKKKYKGKKKDKANEKWGDRRTDNQSNVVDEHITFIINKMTEEEMYNFKSYDVTRTDNDERMIFYDWLADSTTSSHVSAQRDAFITYTPLINSTATGVGSEEARITSHGTVQLLSECNGNKHVL